MHYKNNINDFEVQKHSLKIFPFKLGFNEKNNVVECESTKETVPRWNT